MLHAKFNDTHTQDRTLGWIGIVAHTDDGALPEIIRIFLNGGQEVATCD